MYNTHCYCVILAGGIGSRFWPISREAFPKQFLDFYGNGRSFLRMTYDRMEGVIPKENILVVTLTRYAELVKRQIPEMPECNLLLEEYNRNTAPAIVYATYSILTRDPYAVVVTAPADHIVDNLEAFRITLSNAMDHASSRDALYTIGVKPTRPDPNFGYIQAVGDYSSNTPIKVKTFTEKPNAEMAKILLDTGEFLWNSGIFIWRASVIRSELERLAPEITTLWKGWEKNLGTERERAFVQKVYESNIPRIAIDYAVMEKTSMAWVFPAGFRWADIGNWDSLYEYLSEHDERGNASNFTGKGLMKDCTDSIVFSGKQNKLTAVRGLEDYIVIDTDDVLLICPRDEKKFKEFLSELAMPEFNEFK